MPRRQTKKKYPFTLSGLVAEELMKEYQVVDSDDEIVEQIPLPSDDGNTLRTKIEELNLQSQIQPFDSVVIPNSTDHGHLRIWVTMVDLVNQKRLPERTHLRCWHCHHSFETVPIGCPLHYYNGQDVIPKEPFQKSVLKFNKNNQIAPEPTGLETIVINKIAAMDDPPTDPEEIKILTAQLKREIKVKNNPILAKYIRTMKELKQRKFYETIGIFCSFPCASAYIMKQGHNQTYQESLGLLHQMYRDVFQLGKVPSAFDLFFMKESPDDQTEDTRYLFLQDWHKIPDKEKDEYYKQHDQLFAERTKRIKSRHPSGQIKIPHAPDPMAMLVDYGGIMTIEEYRQKYHLEDFSVTQNLHRRHMLDMVPCGQLIEELIHL